MRAAGTAVTVVIAVAGVGLFLALGVLPRTGTYRTMTVLSGSMRPGIQPGSVVVVRRIDLRDIKVGNVMAFQAPTADRPTVTHRISEVVRAGDTPLVRSKGDANSSVDPWVVQLGPGPGWKLVTTVPIAGHAIHAMQTPVGHRIVTLGMPAAFFVVWMISLLGGEDTLPLRDPSLLALSSRRPPREFSLSPPGTVLGLFRR